MGTIQSRTTHLGSLARPKPPAPLAPEPVVRKVEIRVPVPVPCIDAAAIPSRPAVNRWDEILALPNAAAVATLMTQHNLLIGYAGGIGRYGGGVQVVRTATSPWT